MKAKYRWIVMAACCLGLLCTRTAALSARSAVVLDGDTGEVVFAHNADERLPMASTTKIMTAIVAIEAGDLDRTYTVKLEYTRAEGSSMYLRAGEELTLRETLYGLMLESGNDAALAVAGECGGQEEFVAAMNEKAALLGLGNTHFENPNGLDSENHQTTALELAQLTAYALHDPTFREIVSTRTYSSGTRIMSNHNKLLTSYPGAIGVKTGYTKKSGRCLVSAAERDGRTLIAVTLNDPDDWRDHAALLDQGFARFTPQTLHRAGEVFGLCPVQSGLQPVVAVMADETVTLSLTDEERERLETVVIGRPFVYAPVEAGAVYGQIEYRLDGITLAADTLRFARSSAALPPVESPIERLLDAVTGWLAQTERKEQTS